MCFSWGESFVVFVCGASIVWVPRLQLQLQQNITPTRPNTRPKPIPTLDLFFVSVLAFCVGWGLGMGGYGVGGWVRHKQRDDGSGCFVLGVCVYLHPSLLWILQLLNTERREEKKIVFIEYYYRIKATEKKNKSSGTTIKRNVQDKKDLLNNRLSSLSSCKQTNSKLTRTRQQRERTAALGTERDTLVVLSISKHTNKQRQSDPVHTTQEQEVKGDRSKIKRKHEWVWERERQSLFLQLNNDIALSTRHRWTEHKLDSYQYS